MTDTTNSQSDKILDALFKAEKEDPRAYWTALMYAKMVLLYSIYRNKTNKR